MPEINLIQDTHSPDVPPKKPRKPEQPEMTDPTEESGGLGKMVKTFLGRKKKEEAPATGSEISSMGLGKKSKPDQRIIHEKRSAKPAVIPLPEDEGGFDVNLLDEALVTKFRPQVVLLALLGWAIGAALLVGLAFTGLVIAERSITNQISLTQGELDQVKTDISVLQDEQALIIDTTQKIDAIRNLVERHIRWSTFFTKLESYTLPEVFYGTDFTGDILGEFSITATTDSYESVARQFLVYEEAVKDGDFLKEFSITGAARIAAIDGENISFTVSLNVLPGVFENMPVESDTVPFLQP